MADTDQRVDIGAHRGEITIAESADVEHHVDLARAVAQRGLRLGELGFRRHGAEREAYRRAGTDAGPGEFRRDNGNPIGVDADRCEAVLEGFGADADDVTPGRVGAQNGVINEGGNGVGSELLERCHGSVTTAESGRYAESAETLL